jgi:Phosphate-selective porin O and P
VHIDIVERPHRVLASLALSGALLAASVASAQVTPAAGYTPPDDTPKINLGVTIFADYTYNDAPTIKDSDGNTVNKSEFEIRRAYINVTGQLNHLVSFRITPDVGSRLATSTSASLPSGSSVSASTNYDGSLAFRLKYAFGQLNLDGPLKSQGSWLRLGQQQTPYVDFMEGIYRYRFQGTIFSEREGYLSSSDVGLSGHYNLPNSYGDVHLGYYNGDTYSKAELNDQKAFQVRGTLRPLPRQKVLKGWRLTAFYDHDSPVQNGSRERFIANTTFEHPYVNLGFDYLEGKDQASVTKPEIKSNGWSVWVTPRSKIGIEGLFRYDDVKPNDSVDARKKRTLAGVAYWFKLPKPGLAAAVLADYEQVRYDAALSRPTERRYEIKTLFNY